MIINSTNRLIKYFKNNKSNNNNKNSINILINLNNDYNTILNNNNIRLFTTLNNNNDNNDKSNNINNNSNNDNKYNSSSINKNNKQLKEEQKQRIREITEYQRDGGDICSEWSVKVQEYPKLKPKERILEKQRLSEEIELLDQAIEEETQEEIERDLENQVEDEKNGKNKEEEEEEEEEEAILKEYREVIKREHCPNGDMEHPLIVEDDKINLSHKIISNKLQLLLAEGKEKYIYGIRSIFSFYDSYSSYLPTRNIPLLNPFIYFCQDRCNYLFKKNPFFIIHVLSHSRLYSPMFLKAPKLFQDYLFPKTFDSIPSIINKDEFLAESSKALKQIYKLAENQKSMELQKVSFIPAIADFLTLRDIYYTVGKTSGLEFNVSDISIDNFEFEPINCKVYQEFFPYDDCLILESTYRVVSNKYNQECEEYPVYVNTLWRTPFDEDNEQEIDWKCLNVTFSTDYDPWV